VGNDVGTKISGLSTSLALFTLKNRRKKQANGAILIAQRRQGSLGGVCNLTPSLVCLCAKHHMQMDRQAELCERLSSRRRGYQLTTTENLLREVNSTGVTIVEVVDGYEWRIGGTDLTGKRTTAVAAVGSAIHQMRCLLETMQFPYKQAQEGETR